MADYLSIYHQARKHIYDHKNITQASYTGEKELLQSIHDTFEFPPQKITTEN